MKNLNDSTESKKTPPDEDPGDRVTDNGDTVTLTPESRTLVGHKMSRLEGHSDHDQHEISSPEGNDDDSHQSHQDPLEGRLAMSPLTDPDRGKLSCSEDGRGPGDTEDDSLQGNVDSLEGNTPPSNDRDDQEDLGSKSPGHQESVTHRDSLPEELDNESESESNSKEEEVSAEKSLEVDAVTSPVSIETDQSHVPTEDHCEQEDTEMPDHEHESAEGATDPFQGVVSPSDAPGQDPDEPHDSDDNETGTGPELELSHQVSNSEQWSPDVNMSSPDGQVNPEDGDNDNVTVTDANQGETSGTTKGERSECGSARSHSTLNETDAKELAEITEKLLRCAEALQDVSEDDDEEKAQAKIKMTLAANDAEKTETAKGSDDEDNMPMIRMNSNIFEAQNDEEDEDDDEGMMDPEAIQSMMQVEMEMGEGSPMSVAGYSKSRSTNQEPTQRRLLPRRHAAVVASNTIKQISDLEQTVSAQPTRKDDDVEYIDSISPSASRPTSGERRVSSTSVSGDKQRCHQCRMISPTLVVVRQYGTDINLCSNNCFNTFRNPDPTFRPLPCAKCGALSRDTESSKLYFWETMNFCTDLCVGNFQLQVGSVCSTCSKKTPWTCMGKYCVRFGSDIRQFCTAACLESYKRNARVCFHCQLDIKKLGNVVLANIPFKASPKEFCSQDCVEQYVDQNSPTATRVKPVTMIFCHVCKAYKELFKELVTSIMSYRVCSLSCWEELKEQQLIRCATKCESCPKYINMDTITISPSFYVSSEKKSHGFCSATCKNVFVLKTRQIKPCTTCQVKKYNYDLIHYPGSSATTSFSVCSLNCLPKPSQYILNLKVKLSDPSYVPPVITLETNDSSTAPSTTSTATSSRRCTVDLTNGQDGGQEIQIDGVSSLATEGGSYVNGDGGYLDLNDQSQYYVTTPGAGELTIRQMTELEMQQFQNGGILQIGPGSTQVEMSEVNENGLPVDGEDVDLEDERWAQCDDFVVIRHPEPVERRNKGCQVKPFGNHIETQTDSAELADMPRIQPKVKVLLVPVPVFIPWPLYTCSQPVPIPFPMGVPVPIPIPIIFDKNATEPPKPIENPLSPRNTMPEELSKEQPMLETVGSPLVPAETLEVDDSMEDAERMLENAMSPLTPPGPAIESESESDEDSEVPLKNVSSPLTAAATTGLLDTDSMELSLANAVSPMTPNPTALENEDAPVENDIMEENPVPSLSNTVHKEHEKDTSSVKSPDTTTNHFSTSEPVQSFPAADELSEDEMMDTSEPLESTPSNEMEFQPISEPTSEAPPPSHVPGSSTVETGSGPAGAVLEPVEIQGKTPTRSSTPSLFNYGNSGSPKSGPPSVNSYQSFLGGSSPAPGSPSLRGRGNRAEYGLRAWKLTFGDEDPAALLPEALAEKLEEWMERGSKPKGDRYEPDALFYFCLGIQGHLRLAGRFDQIFYDALYTPFVVSLTAYAELEMSKGRDISRVEEDHVWEGNELGPVSPGVLLFTLIYYIYKHFGLKTWEEHGALDFRQVKINTRKSVVDGSLERYVSIVGITNCDDELIEVTENPENPYRCMVKLMEFYSSKSESTEGNLYKSIKPNHEPRGVWYADQPLSQMDLYRMLVRAQMISSNS